MVHETTEVAVVGGGANGLAVALGLARAGVGVTLLGAVDAPREDGRTAALMQPSLDFLTELDVMAPLSANAHPLAAIRLIDITGALLRAPTVTFRAAEIDLPHFALNFSNADIVRVLTATLRTLPAARVETAQVSSFRAEAERAELTLADGRRLNAALVVAADGQKSALREAAGIAARRWTYDQVALTFHVRHTKDHEDISTEFHTRAGPLTYVPFGDFISSVVWLVNRTDADRLTALLPQEVAQACQRMSSSLLGDLTVIGGVGAVPMGGLIAKTAVAGRLALVGEALHAFPPVGAQGMNLGLRDASSLVAHVVRAHAAGEDVGAAAVLGAYDRGRQVDAVSRTYGVDLLNRSLIADILPLDLLRVAGLSAAASLPPLRRLLMRAGMGAPVLPG